MDETYVTKQIRKNNENVNVNVKSESFKKWIVSQFYNIEGKKEKVNTFEKKDLGVFFEEIIQSNMLGELFKV